MTPQQKEAHDLVYVKGMSKSEAARHLGISRSSLRDRLSKGSKDPAISEAMAAVGTEMVPSTVWVKTATHSVMLRPVESKTGLIEHIRDAMEDLQAIAPVATPDHTEADLLTCYTLADVHMGMLAWGDECGEDYDTEIASERVRKWVSHCVSQAPASEEAIILDIGDLMHANDNTNQTQASKHVLDTDTRFFRTVDVTIETMAAAVEIALTKHRKVSVRIMRGNHDPEAYIAIMFGLLQRYRKEPRVDIEKTPVDFFARQWGKVMLAGHHGDRSKATGLVLHMADRYADMWGGTKWRYLFTGHLHHHKSQDIGGVHWEQLRAVTAKDAYAASYPFSARSEMQAITYHKERGEVSRVRVSNWL